MIFLSGLLLNRLSEILIFACAEKHVFGFLFENQEINCAFTHLSIEIVWYDGK